MISKAAPLHAPSVAPEYAVAAFVLLVLATNAALLFSWLGIGS